VHPAVIEAFTDGRLTRSARRSKAKAALLAPEETLLLDVS
jgi:hypothetical protein